MGFLAPRKAAKRESARFGTDVAQGSGAMKIARVVLSFCGAGALSLGLIGCAAKPVPQRAAGVAVASDDSANVTIFGSQQVHALIAGQQLVQSDWRDASLNIRTARTAYEQAAWPDIMRPSLGQTRRVIFSNQPNSVTYFRAEGVSVRGGREYVLP